MAHEATLERFGGLDLRDASESPAQTALAGSDFDLEPGGNGVRSRRGFYRFNSVADEPSPVSSSIEFVAGFNTQRSGALVLCMGHASSGSVPKAFDANGNLLFSGMTGLQLGDPVPNGGTAFGTPGAERYIFNPDGRLALFDPTSGFSRYLITLLNGVTGAVLTSTGGAPSGQSVCTWPTQNRLVNCGFSRTQTAHGPNGLVSGPDYAWISEPGRHDLYRNDAFELLTPGDGEIAWACCSWRDMVFIFKQTKFFVFTSVGVDNNGVPSFNYRTIDTGLGALGPAAVAAGRDGVYFVGRRGIYRTTGAEPQLISSPLQPLFDRVNQPYYSGFSASTIAGGARMAWADERLYLHTGSGAPPVSMLVYDAREDAWLSWKPPGGAVLAGMGVARLFTDPAAPIYASGKQLFIASSSLSRDGIDEDPARNLVNVSSSWMGRFADLGSEEVKRLYFTTVHGHGPTASLDWLHDYQPTPSPHGLSLPAEVSFGRSHVGYLKRGYRGRRFAPYLSGSGRWAARRIVARFSDPRRAGGDDAS